MIVCLDIFDLHGFVLVPTRTSSEESSISYTVTEKTSPIMAIENGMIKVIQSHILNVIYTIVYLYLSKNINNFYFQVVKKEIDCEQNIIKPISNPCNGKYYMTCNI